MLDITFAVGQAASALLMIYGAYLVFVPVGKAAERPAAMRAELALLES